MLRIAVPNKGSLSEPATAMLREAGYRQRAHTKELTAQDPANGVEFFYLRPRDIAVYVGSGQLDLGITGRDLLVDSGADAEEALPLGFARSALRWATPPGPVKGVADLEGRTIATSYPGIVRRYLDRQRVTAEIVRLDGAVETAIRLGVADAVAEVVETGTTFAGAGLHVVGEPILESEAVVVRRRGTGASRAAELFLRRMNSVLIARRYVLMDYDVQAEHMEAAIALTPGLRSPTISPLHTSGWVAVRAMVPREQAQHVMDHLYAIGARAILVTTIHACRL